MAAAGANNPQSSEPRRSALRRLRPLRFDVKGGSGSFVGPHRGAVPPDDSIRCRASMRPADLNL